MQCFILSDSERLVPSVQQALARHAIRCPADHLIALNNAHQLAEARPELIILCLSPDPDRSLSVLAALRPYVKARVLAVGPDADPKLILRSMRAGADDFLGEDTLDAELDDALQRSGDRLGTSQPNGRMVAIMSACGGSGGSTLAVNFAAALAKSHGGSILIDLKLETGDLAALFDLRPPHTLVDLFRKHASVERAMLEQSLARHSSGVRVLASPRQAASTMFRLTDPGALNNVSAANVRQVLVLARTLTPQVVVEVSPTFREEQTQALRMADLVLLVLRPDFTSLRNARRALEHLDMAGVQRDQIRVVSNRTGQAHGLSLAQSEEAIGRKIAYQIPDDPKPMNLATNIGAPVVLSSPSSRSSRSLSDLTLSLNRASKSK